MDDLNRILLATRTLLACHQRTGRILLVDTGTGSKWNPRMAERYGVTLCAKAHVGRFSDGETTVSSGYAAVDRSQGEDGPVRLYFFFSDWQELPGWFRVTSFNTVGESDISDEALYL